MVLARRFSTRAGSVSGVAALEDGNLTELASGDEETRLFEFDDVNEPEFERPFSIGIDMFIVYMFSGKDIVEASSPPEGAME
jgi:hypothetical protein